MKTYGHMHEIKKNMEVSLVLLAYMLCCILQNVIWWILKADGHISGDQQILENAENVGIFIVQSFLEWMCVWKCVKVSVSAARCLLSLVQ